MNAELKVDRRGESFIEAWEVFVPYWYDDKRAPFKGTDGKLTYHEWKGEAVKGTLTIGIGHTKAAHGKVPCEVGYRMTHEEGLMLLGEDMEPVQAFIRHVVKVALSQCQFDALGSLVYNIGEGNFQHSSVLKFLNMGEYEKARAAFDRFVYSKGEYMKGLQRRRDAEQALWDEAMEPHHLPEEIVEHPAEVDAAKTTSMAKSTEGWTAAAQTVGAGGGAGEQTINAWDAADKVLEAKDKAEQFGIEPIHLFDKMGATVSILVHSPAFWVCVVLAGAGAYLWLRRRYRLKLEM